LKEQLPFLPRHLQNEIEIRVSVRQLTELKLPSRIATVWLVQHFNRNRATKSKHTTYFNNGQFLNGLLYAFHFPTVLGLWRISRSCCHSLTNLKYYCFQETGTNLAIIVVNLKLLNFYSCMCSKSQVKKYYHGSRKLWGNIKRIGWYILPLTNYLKWFRHRWVGLSWKKLNI